MKLILTIFGLMMVLTFGAISTVGNSGGIVASTTSPSASIDCHDDGDDDLPGNEEPVDDPDSEDNEGEEVPGERNDEPADPEDDDPSYEDDDDVNCDLGPTAILGETGTPSATPCPTFNPVSAQGEQCCGIATGAGTGSQTPSPFDPCDCFIPTGEVGAELFPGIECCFYFPFLCCDLGFTGDIGAQLPPPCFCYEGGDQLDAELIDPCCFFDPFLCCDSAAGGEVGAEGLFCCLGLDGDEVGAEGPFCCPPLCGAALEADVDCDGDVTAADAYTSLANLGGVAEATTGCDSGGDADCSGAVDALDTLAILKVIAGFAEPAAC